MKTFLRGEVTAANVDAYGAPRALRTRLRQLTYAPDVQFIEGTPIGEPRAVRVLYDATTQMPDARRFSETLREIAAQVDGFVENFEANGGRSTP